LLDRSRVPDPRSVARLAGTPFQEERQLRAVLAVMVELSDPDFTEA
jgi:hypothetical protein